MATKQTKKGWDSEENEAKSISFKWGKFADDDYNGDRILGVMLSKQQIPNKKAKDPNAKQWVYEVKVRECEFHDMDKKQNAIEPSIVIAKGEVINIYGRAFYDKVLRQVKIGQVFGLKYIKDIPATVAGNSDTKEIKVFLPKVNGEYEMDEEVVNQGNLNDFDDE